jgi:predicted TIM-barrel fold metal-dependent hydrolase
VVLAPDRWMEDFEKLDIKEAIRPLILRENAVTALGLTSP